MAGLFPFGASSGAPSVGIPVGRHAITHESVCCDPFAWHNAGLVANLGMAVLGAPGYGKTALVKRIVRGLIATGARALILGDPKGEYTAVVLAANGQVIRVGRGMSRINPLDAGPLGAALERLDGATRLAMLAEVRGQRLNALLALVSLIRKEGLADWEHAVLGAALDSLTDGGVTNPTIPEVLNVVSESGYNISRAAQVDPTKVNECLIPLRRTLQSLLDGPLRGVFDGPTTTTLDMNAPAVSIDLSRVTGAGDVLLRAGMLSAWSFGTSTIEASGVLDPTRRIVAVLDELWRALRGSSALVEQADALTRVYRHKSVAHVLVTHGLDDFAAVGDDSDRAKARGFMDRCAITVLTAMSGSELTSVSKYRHLTSRESALVRSWSSPPSWTSGGMHHGRGKYLIKAGDRVGIPIEMTFVGDESQLYGTDPGSL